MTAKEFGNLLQDELQKAISSAQVLAAVELQGAQGDLIAVSNIIIKQSAAAAAGAVVRVLVQADIITADPDVPAE